MAVVKCLLHNGFVGVRLNENTDFFLTSRVVRQGNPISPILFNFVPDVFTKMLVKAAASRQFVGLNVGLLVCNMLMAPSCF
jgi:hypothetical protein